MRQNLVTRPAITDAQNLKKQKRVGKRRTGHRCYIDRVPTVAGRLTEVDEVLIGFFESSDSRFTGTANFRSLNRPEVVYIQESDETRIGRGRGVHDILFRF